MDGLAVRVVNGDHSAKVTLVLRRTMGKNVTLRYRGREMAHQDLGQDVLTRIREDLAEIAQVEQFPKLEGRQMIMVLAPKRKK